VGGGAGRGVRRPLRGHRRAGAGADALRDGAHGPEFADGGEARADAAALAPVRDALARALADKRAFDVRRGATHAGPHRDDLEIALGGRDLRVYGSGGQQRTAAIALRMLEAATLRDAIGGPPVFLLDDPFAELDARRAHRILGCSTRPGSGRRSSRCRGWPTSPRSSPGWSA
jgi:hypothetical protein